eukprot:3288115-Lingulodinium_polyedra.AAC.1
MDALDSEHLLSSVVEAAMALRSSAEIAAAAMTDQHRQGPSLVVADAGTGTLQGGASSTHAPTAAVIGG